MSRSLAIQTASSLALGLASALTVQPAGATDFNARAVMEKMAANERLPYISGVVEGLAYARFVRDGKKSTTGMMCIYDWFYKKTETINLIYAALGRYGDYPAGAIIQTLVNKHCGE